MSRFIVVFIIATAASWVRAEEPTAKVRVRLQSGSGFARQDIVSATPLWALNEDKAQEFFWRVRLDLPRGRSVRTISGRSSVINSLVGGAAEAGGARGKSRARRTEVKYEGAVYIDMRALADVITIAFDDGTAALLRVDLAIVPQDRVRGWCDELGLAIEPVAPESVAAKPTQTLTATSPTPSSSRSSPRPGDPPVETKAASSDREPRERLEAIAPLPGYLYYRCDNSAQGTVLSVSVPQEIEWRSTSLYETHGKGKRARTFLINSQIVKSKEKDIATLSFLRSGKVFVFAVRVPQAKDLVKISNFRFGLGMMQLALEGASQSASLMKPTAIVSLELRPLGPRWVVGAQGLSSLPVVGSGKFITHTETLGFFAYSFGTEAGFRYEPRAYLYFADGVSQEVDSYYSLAVPAAGFFIASSELKKWRYQGEALYGMIGGQTVTSVRLSAGMQIGFGEAGVSLVWNSMGANMDNAKKTTGSQIAAGLYIEF